MEPPKIYDKGVQDIFGVLEEKFACGRSMNAPQMRLLAACEHQWERGCHQRRKPIRPDRPADDGCPDGFALLYCRKNDRYGLNPWIDAFIGLNCAVMAYTSTLQATRAVDAASDLFSCDNLRNAVF